MSEGFAQAYEKLREFIVSHPEIDIGESVTSIPENVRPEFYVRFNAVREAYVEDRFAPLLNRARLLQENFSRAEKNLAELFSWEETPVVSPVQRFLRGYMDSMTRELFDPLFDMLKGKQTIGSFGQTASEKISALWPAVFRGGYEKWVILSLARLLEPEKVLQVNCGFLGPGERAKTAAYAPLTDVPDPEESGSLFFSPPRNAVFAVPDLIIRSGALNCYVAIRSEFSEGLYNAMNISSAREWSPVDTDLLVAMENGLTLVYTADRPEDIALVADAARFCRPDMMLWCVDAWSMDRKEVLSTMELCDSRINPKKGSFVIADEPWPEPVEPSQNSRIQFLIAGFEQRRLNPIVDTLKEDEPQITQISQKTSFHGTL